MITQISVDNFRSVRGAQLRLSPLNFFCGPNASGKTNLAEALDFLANAFRSGLSYAVAEKGGFYNMCFRRQRRSRSAISFSITGRTLLQALETTVDYQVSFSLQTRGESIRSDYYVEFESYTFHVTTKAGEFYKIQVKREGEKIRCGHAA